MAPRSEEELAKQRQLSRKKILESAMTLFSKKGYDGTSINMIAKNAGVSKGLIYNYFDTKEEIVKEVILYMIGIGTEFMRDGLKLKDPMAKLKFLIIDSMKTYIEYKEMAKLFMGFTFQIDIFNIIKDEMKVISEQLFAFVEDIFEGLGFPDPKLETKLLTSALDGIQLHMLFFDEEYPVDKVCQTILQRYIQLYEIYNRQV